MAQIGLEGMTFFAHHGVFPEENTVGNRYDVSVYLTTDIAEAAEHDSIRHTIDYGRVYQIVSEEMQAPRKLLETLAVHIGRRLVAEYAQVQQVLVRVSKYNPPIKGICERAYVEHTEIRG